MPNQTMVYSCSGAEQEYTMVWFGIFLYLLVSSLKIRFCEQSVFAKSPLQNIIQTKHYPTPPLLSSYAKNSIHSIIQRPSSSSYAQNHYQLSFRHSPRSKQNLFRFAQHIAVLYFSVTWMRNTEIQMTMETSSVGQLTKVDPPSQFSPF